ncbi:MAG: DHH family phosphoesterase [Paludibacteraceae bacterium]|nr:DHH family phosphoesterase [Paludibacteraceae bacterium]
MKFNYLRNFALGAVALCSLASCEKEDDSNSDPFNFGDSKIVVIGHKVPDTDAVTSAMAYAIFLRSLGYDCEARVAGALNKETMFALDTFGIKAPELLTSADNLNVVIVDHSEYAQSVNGMRNANILRVVDNHLLGSMTDAASYDTTRSAGSTCTIIYYDFKEMDVTITKETAQLLLLGILSDTGGLKPTKSNSKDSVVVNDLVSVAGITDLAAFYTRMSEFADSYDGMTDAEILASDIKDYERAGYKYSVANVDVDRDDYLEDMRNRMLAVMPDYMKKNNLDFMLCKIDADTLDCSNLLYMGENAEKFADAAFLNMGIEDVTSEKKDGYIYMTPHVSRKVIIVPRLNDVLDANAKE